MSRTAKEIVKDFILNVRSRKDPSQAFVLMGDEITSHNIRSEMPGGEMTYHRTPQMFVDHLQEMKDEDGDFTLELQELFGNDEKVYARIKETYDLPGGKKKYEYISFVYRVENEKIVEYWLTLDRTGVEKQNKDLGV